MLKLEEMIQLLKNASIKLREEFNDEFVGLALFGSWARGEACEESDVDILNYFKEH